MPSSSGRRASESIPHRKALSVLPEPVGAQISVFAPEAIAGQPSACAGVGASNEASNQRRVRSLKASSGLILRSLFGCSFATDRSIRQPIR